LIRDGEGGYLVSGGAADYAEKIATLIADKTQRSEMGRRNRDIIKSFDISNVLGIMEREYAIESRETGREKTNLEVSEVQHI
jgi:glycosyltransferase involved in cell wall biosynthesis